MKNLLNYCDNISTPAVIFKYEQGIKNILSMQSFANSNNVLLRPHIKAHKIPKIALLQIENGAKGITASKIDEVEVMINAGIKDIILAYPVVGEDKVAKFISLAKQAHLGTIVDNIDVASALSKAAIQENVAIDVYIKIDTGLHRLGLEPGERVIELAKDIIALKGLNFKGILTHAGHVYGVSSHEKVVEIGTSEGTIMVDCAKSLEDAGVKVPVVSIGSTPTARYGGKVKGVDEIRPGNYVFNDAIQVGLGVATQDECSLRVIATVVGRPAPNRVIIDAGSKVFALDKGAHGNSIVNGFGIIINHPNATLARLSEEHGVIEWPENEKINIGDRLEIIPNHACTVINLTDEVQFWYGDNRFETVKVSARGKVK